ncbi:MAG: hypothetical protein HYZ72_18150, partial [Deltaproteobacteria bacterium]|nr:hypothetical protein [Deltaproteobacteria bacterium]
MSVPAGGGPWRTLVRLAVPYRRQFIAVMLLAVLGTAAELVEPLIYRAAINDVAGVFVQRASEHARTEHPAGTGRPRHTAINGVAGVFVQPAAERGRLEHPADAGKARPRTHVTPKPRR